MEKQSLRKKAKVIQPAFEEMATNSISTIGDYITKESERKKPIFKHFRDGLWEMGDLLDGVLKLSSLVNELQNLVSHGSFGSGYNSIEEADEALERIKVIRSELDRIAKCSLEGA